MTDVMPICGVIVLLTGFALLVVRRNLRWLAVGQSAAACVAAALACWTSPDVAGGLVLAAAICGGGIAALAPWTVQPRAALTAVPAGVVALLLCLVSVPAEIRALSLTTVLLGLITVASRPLAGAMCLVNGTLLALGLASAPGRGAFACGLGLLAAGTVFGWKLPWRQV